MKIEVELKITITPEEGEAVEAYSDNVIAESKDIATAVNMINVGIEKMDAESNKAMLLKIDELNNSNNNE